MGTASSGTNLVSTRYASALLDMAAEANLVEKVEKDLVDLAAMVAASADLAGLIRNPLVSSDQQLRGILAIAEKAKFEKLTYNFLGVLAENRRLPVLDDVIGAFHAELKKRRGIVEARVESAYALSAAQTKALQEHLGEAMGTHVTLDVSVNKDLLGGMIVTVGSRMIDDSVRRKLERLEMRMSSQTNQNQQLKEVG